MGFLTCKKRPCKTGYNAGVSCRQKLGVQECIKMWVLLPPPPKKRTRMYKTYMLLLFALSCALIYVLPSTVWARGRSACVPANTTHVALMTFICRKSQALCTPPLMNLSWRLRLGAPARGGKGRGGPRLGGGKGQGGGGKAPRRQRGRGHDSAAAKG